MHFPFSLPRTGPERDFPITQMLLAAEFGMNILELGVSKLKITAESADLEVCGHQSEATEVFCLSVNEAQHIYGLVLPFFF